MKTVKSIKINPDKCSGCRACELICSSFHAVPKYSSTNPERSRIRVSFDPLKNLFIPVIASGYTKAECNGRHTYTINGQEYDECSFCGASCPYRDIFKEPDSGFPLKCDMCEEEPPLPEPLCVQWCVATALTYEEREEEEEKEEEKPGEMEIGLEALVNKHGLKTVKDALARIPKG